MKRVTLLTVLALGTSLSLATAFAADAKDNYEKLCTKCHGAEGKGDTKMGQKLKAKDYSDPKVQDALKDDAAFKSIKEGLKDKEADKPLMKPFTDLSDDEIKALVAYMRKFKK